MKLINEQIEEQREHFDNVRLLSLLLEVPLTKASLSQLELHIGYVYGSTEFPHNASAYRHKYVPGARLPHAWIKFPGTSSVKHPPAVDVSYVSEFGHDEIQARQYSTLDLCAPDAFTLIVGSLSVWKARTEQVKSHAWQRGIPLNIRYLGTDFEPTPGAYGDAWLDALQFAHGGGVLVRPDQHILMLLGAETSIAEVGNELERHLGL